MMRKIITFLVVAGLILAFAPGAFCNQFIEPPEVNPNISWVTQYPYQRNILLDFNQDPVGPTGPIPGAQYTGYDDPVLWNSDFVTIDGDILWAPDVGGIGLFETGSGNIIFHLDNWERPWPIKHVYFELIFKLEGGGNIDIYDIVPSDYERTDIWTDVIFEQNLLVRWWIKYEPNPPWEEFIISLGKYDIGYIYIDSVHIATECIIPAPGAIILCALGTSIVGFLRRRKTI